MSSKEAKVECKTKKIKYNNEKQGFGGAAPNKVESYAEGVVSEHEVQMNHAIGMDITLFLWKAILICLLRHTLFCTYY